MSSTQLGLPVSIQEKMTEAVFKAFMEMFPKEELQERINVTILKFFNDPIGEPKPTYTRFDCLIFDTLKSYIAPLAAEMLKNKETEFQKQMEEQFLGELKQTTNQGVDNITAMLTLSASRLFASEVMKQAHSSAVMAVTNAYNQTRYGGDFGSALSNVMSAYMPFCNTKEMSDVAYKR